MLDEAFAGSSPRVRGKPRREATPRCDGGLIPARAGKTSPGAVQLGGRGAHPRACGENWGGRRTQALRRGSSPRVRGKLRALLPPPPLDRLIPARAGKTSRSAIRCPPGWAHPRACGENVLRPVVTAASVGSSPRVRGKLGHILGGHVERGLIPARAGKTPVVGSPRTCSGAHPRACGENGGRDPRDGAAQGSSPRVRGKRERFADRRCDLRLIPARAGKTVRHGAGEGRSAAHPRACGENSVDRERALAVRGSSPRVRGKHFLTWAFTVRVGRILETLEPSAFSGSYSFPGARANGGQRRAHRRGLCTGPALGRPLGAS